MDEILFRLHQRVEALQVIINSDIIILVLLYYYSLPLGTNKYNESKW